MGTDMKTKDEKREILFDLLCAGGGPEEFMEICSSLNMAPIDADNYIYQCFGMSGDDILEKLKGRNRISCYK